MINQNGSIDISFINNLLQHYHSANHTITIPSLIP